MWTSTDESADTSEETNADVMKEKVNFNQWFAVYPKLNRQEFLCNYCVTVYLLPHCNGKLSLHSHYVAFLPHTKVESRINISAKINLAVKSNSYLLHQFQTFQIIYTLSIE